MKRFQFILVILLFLSCKKSADKLNIITPEIKLITPLNDLQVQPCNIEFRWEKYDSTKSAALSVSTNQDFNAIIFDTITDLTNYVYKHNFQPGKKYYWKITQDTIIAKASFIINDIFDSFKPYYIANIYRENWNMTDGITSSAHFFDTIYLRKSGDSIYFNCPLESISAHLVYKNYYYENNLFYISDPFYASVNAVFYYNCTNDSILIGKKSGGLGAGTRWTLATKL